MTKAEFKTLLAKHGLTANTFLDICDEWDKLRPIYKYELLREDSNIPEVSDGRVENISNRKS